MCRNKLSLAGAGHTDRVGAHLRPIPMIDDDAHPHIAARLNTSRAGSKSPATGI